MEMGEEGEGVPEVWGRGAQDGHLDFHTVSKHGA